MAKIKTAADLEAAIDNQDERIQEVTTATAAMQAHIKSLTLLAKGKYFGTPQKETDESDQRFGAFARALIAAKSGSPTSEQRDLLVANKGSFGLETKADLGTPLANDSTTGSYLVPVEYYNEILRVAADISPIQNMVKKIKMNSRTKYYPTSGTATAFNYVSSDGGEITEQNPTFGQSLLTSYTYAMWVGLTEALIEDDNVGLGEYLRTLAGEAYAAKFDAELFTGSGSPTTGVLNDGSVNTYTMGAGSTSINDIGIDDLYAMVEELTTQGKRAGARYFLHPLLWDKVRKMKDADGQNLIAPWAEQAAKQLFGYPVTFSDQLPSADASGTAFIAFGNPKHLVHGDRIGMEMKYYDATQYAVQYTETFFRFRFRAAFDVGVPAAFSILKTAS